VEFCGGSQDAAHGGLLKDWCGVGALQLVKKARRDAGYLIGAAGVGVGGAGCGAEASCCGGFETFTVGEIVAPVEPEAGFAESELAVGFEAVVAFLRDFILASLPGLDDFGSFRFFQQFCKDI